MSLCILPVIDKLVNKVGVDGQIDYSSIGGNKNIFINGVTIGIFKSIIFRAFHNNVDPSFVLDTIQGRD